MGAIHAGSARGGAGQVRQGIAAEQATGAALAVPGLYALLAEIYDHLGHPEEALQALAEAHTLMEQHEERWWEAAIHCLRGVLLLRQVDLQEARALLEELAYNG